MFLFSEEEGGKGRGRGVNLFILYLKLFVNDPKVNKLCGFTHLVLFS